MHIKYELFTLTEEITFSAVASKQGEIKPSLVPISDNFMDNVK